MYGYREREIKKEEYEEIKANKKNPYSLFDAAAVMGYGLSIDNVFERDGKCYVGYYMSDSCD